MTWLQNRWLRWVILGGSAGVLAAFTLRNVLSPIRYLPEDRVWVFISPSCPYSVDIFSQVTTSMEKFGSDILLLPADDSPSSLASSLGMCNATLKQISWHERFPARFLPEGLACRWLVEDGAKVHHGVSVDWPSWYYKGHILGDNEFIAIMNDRGLSFDNATNTLLHHGETVSKQRLLRFEKSEHTVNETVWDDLSEPHAVGW